MNVKFFKYIFSAGSLFWMIGFGMGAYFSVRDGMLTAGIVFAACAFIFPIIDFLVIRKLFVDPLTPEQIMQIKSSGQKIQTTFKALDRRWNVSVNGQSPIIVYTQDAQGRIYQSEDLWFSGGDASAYSDPRFVAWQKLQSADPSNSYSIPVYINPNKPKQYYMDLGGMK